MPGPAATALSWPVDTQVTANHTVTAGACRGSLDCQSTNTRPYLTGPCCPLHTPAANAGHPEPGRTADASWLTKAQRTLPGAKGGSDLDKEKPGGYMSRQRAARIAETRDNIRANRDA